MSCVKGRKSAVKSAIPNVHGALRSPRPPPNGKICVDRAAEGISNLRVYPAEKRFGVARPTVVNRTHCVKAVGNEPKLD